MFAVSARNSPIQNAEDDFVRYIPSFREKSSNNMTINERQQELKGKLNNFYSEPGLPVPTGETGATLLRDFWNVNKNTYPVLLKWYSIFTGVPSTQVTDEKLFSTLKFILSERRNKLLSPQMEENLIFLNLNWDLVSDMNLTFD